ncbi:MAG: hydrogenase expression/formation protein HypE [bacterium]
MSNDERITLADGGGGIKTMSLLKELLLPSVCSIDESMEDGALLGGTRLVFTTDSFTVSPIFFPGGDIGRLSVFGTVNDLAVMGALPDFLSVAMIIEEGFIRKDLERLASSIGLASEEVGIKVVCGDTKVVPKGSVDGIYINTSGIGRLFTDEPLVAERAEAGDEIVLSGDIGRHEAVILIARGELGLKSKMKSDLAPIFKGVEALYEGGTGIVFARDLTRGGLSMALYELAGASHTQVIVSESLIPVCKEVRGLCEILGLEEVFLACEGTFIAVVKDGEKAVEILREVGYQNASLIGHLEKSENLTDVERVIIETKIGSRRFMPLPIGELSPRIC